jgi:chorismate dehydratase
MTPLRLGVVGYLNSRPLVHGLDAEPAAFALRFDVPSRCAALLHGGEIDLGLLPSIEYLRGDYRLVPGVALASEGPVASVAVFSARRLAQARRVALDTSSRTSVALLRVLCAERFGVSPVFVEHGPDLAAMLRVADAALLIGDRALWTDHAALGLEKVDLGAEWTAHTGLPFVWACWTGRPGAVDAATVVRLQRVRDEGLAAIDRIADRYAAGDAERARGAVAYLRHNMKYGLGAREEAALRRFYASAARLGIVPTGPGPRFYDRVGASTAASRAGRSV